jgi:hypothetical protein
MVSFGAVWGAILPCPRIDRAEQDAVRLENVVVGDRLGPCEMRKGLVEPRRERRVLGAFHDREVFLFFEIAQITFGREITERIEGHGLVSRRYST